MADVFNQFMLSVRVKKRGLVIFTLLLITTLYLLILHALPTMLDPDGFFHAKMALLTKEHGFVSLFPYLPETFLNTYWTDQHWLYHVFLIPFVSWMDPLWGVKLGALVLGVMYIAVFYYTLRELLRSDRAAFWWSIVLLTAAPFIFRIVLVKAQPLALILLLVGILLFFKRKHILLFIIQFLYVLAHGSFLMLPFLALWSLLYTLLFDIHTFKTNRLSTMKSILAMFLGVVLGVWLQPTFPENLVFYWHQIITIGIIGVPEFVATGLEWRSITIIELFKSLSVLSVFLLTSLPFFVYYRKLINTKVFIWTWLLIPLTILSLSSIRNLEFLTPFFVIALASIWNYIPIKSITTFFASLRITNLFIGAVLSVSMITWILYPIVLIFSTQERALPLTMFENEGIQINKTIGDNDLVINNRWDSFPMLFYYTKEARFLSGLDPAFLYISNPEKYTHLVNARESGNLEELLESLKGEYEDIYIAEIIIDEKPQKFHAESYAITPIVSGVGTALYHGMLNE